MCGLIELPSYFYFIRDFRQFFEIKLIEKIKEFNSFKKFYTNILKYFISFYSYLNPNINKVNFIQILRHQFLESL